MNRWIFGFLRRVFKALMRKPAVYGVENIDRARPAVFVANHLGSFGPVVLSVFLPFKFLPWVTHEITESGLCADYLRRDFVEPELGLKPPFSGLVSAAIGRICVSLMKHIGAIPVYKRSRRLGITLDRTVKALAEGKYVLIFPEVADGLDRRTSAGFQAGFINVARILYAMNGTVAVFYPICVDRENNVIHIGRPIAYDPRRTLREEKLRIAAYLWNLIRDMPRDGGN